MRLFSTLSEAESEIRRDLAKGTPNEFTRVQQRTGLSLAGRERLGYEYAIQQFEPLEAGDLLEFGKNRGFPLYCQHGLQMMDWLNAELDSRLDPIRYLCNKQEDLEINHPALKTTLEGNHPSYTYPERMIGMLDHMVNTLNRNRDSRRAFWPIFQPQDGIRSAEATRVPCSLGYQAMIRWVGGHEELLFFYIERSCDFDHFWLSDIWFARKIQETLAQRLAVRAGLLHHFIISFHSFEVDDQEIY